eukprot:6199518-Pleurochrysis_carterae.AAC.1
MARSTKTPWMWEADELNSPGGRIKTKPIAFHSTLAGLGIAEWADIYDPTTRKHYTMSAFRDTTERGYRIYVECACAAELVVPRVSLSWRARRATSGQGRRAEACVVLPSQRKSAKA